MTDPVINAKSFRDNQAEESIARAIFETVRSQWTELRDVQKMLISLAGKLAIAETYLGQKTSDSDQYSCACGLDDQLNIKLSIHCRVHSDGESAGPFCDQCGQLAYTVVWDLQEIDSDGPDRKYRQIQAPRFGCRKHPQESRKYDLNGNLE